MRNLAIVTSAHGIKEKHNMEELLTVAEVSKALKVTKDQVYRWIKAGTLCASKFPSGTIRISEEQIKDFLAEEKVSEKT